ncbi:ATP-grasp fold amidoligase family protein [Paraferrimonas sedimenticola]|uniref:Glycosyl transferase n=1 Tax=Paraferrimonas sedimenticola TaxID=375674 RepID=A0AA37RZS7_9GAMM|nr:ATP-grasp fold amidoligase family protein [Paraferrimonas sedimenticola]GLP98108.1 glycosyl transferase [Paraferrimonas sedimenticola]
MKLTIATRAKQWLKDKLPNRAKAWLYFYRMYGRLPRRNFTLLNEFIALRKANPTKGLGLLTDKLFVRQYITERIGAQYLVPLLGVYQSPQEVQFSELPEHFVLKLNYATKHNFFCRNNTPEAQHNFIQSSKEWLSDDHSAKWGENHYQEVQHRRIIAEQMLLDSNDKLPKDYKFHFFNDGRQLRFIIEVDSNRFEDYRKNFYDQEWRPLNIDWGLPSGELEPKPPQLDKAVQLLKQLAHDFNYVRIDVYLLDNAIYFGELTFTHGAGTCPLSPVTFDQQIAACIAPDEEFYPQGCIRDYAKWNADYLAFYRDPRAQKHLVNSPPQLKTTGLYQAINK